MVFRRNEINYMHIFDLDERHRVGQNAIWGMSMILLFIWTMCYCINILEISKQIKDDMTNKKPNKFEHHDWVSMLLATVFIVMCIQPCIKTF